MERPEWEKHSGAMGEKVCLITGATSGIGKATAMGLATLGASGVMVGRARAKSEAVMAEIKEKSGNTSVDLMLADLSSQGEIRRLADVFKEAYPRLDVLINNAGVFRSKRITTADGLETTFAVNHLAYFLLTKLLLDVVKASAPSRIVNVSSGEHSNATIDFDDLQGEKGYKGPKAYSQSKLATVLFTLRASQETRGNRCHRQLPAPRRTYSGQDQLRGRSVWGLGVHGEGIEAFHDKPREGSRDLHLFSVLPRGGGLERQVLRQESRGPLITCVLR
jgi:NAD(P)-dependent dehydrogenase (short-subunit alcohol dehydrogenase family)